MQYLKKKNVDLALKKYFCPLRKLEEKKYPPTLMDNLIFKLPVPYYKYFIDPCPPCPFTGITPPTRPSRSPGSSQTAVPGEESLAVPAKAILPDFSSTYFSSFSPLLLQLANLQSLLQSLFFPLDSVGVHIVIACYIAGPCLGV